MLEYISLCARGRILDIRKQQGYLRSYGHLYSRLSICHRLAADISGRKRCKRRHVHRHTRRYNNMKKKLWMNAKAYCWWCKKHIRCDCCDATCWVCGRPYAKDRCREFGFSDDGKRRIKMKSMWKKIHPYNKRRTK